MIETVEKFSEAALRCAVCETTEDLAEGIYDGEEKAVCSCCESSYFAYCGICGGWNYAEDAASPCRHLFWDGEAGCWGGCGSDNQKYKESVWALLELLDRAVVVRLKDALQRHRYYLQFRGSIFGVEEIHTELLDEDLVTWVPDAFHRVFQADPDTTIEARNGVNWLMSLWAGYDDNWEPETPEADKLTAGWIEEWLKAKQTGEQHG